MPHLDPDRLALIAVGEAVTDAEHEHLAACDVCAIELAELEHTVAVGRSTVSLGELEAPPVQVWDRILDEIRSHPTPGVAGADAAAGAGAGAGAGLGADAAADAGAALGVDAAADAGAAPGFVPAAAPGRAAESSVSRPARRRLTRRGRVLLALAASVAAVLAVVGTWSLVRAPQAVEVASAVLAAFPDHPGAAGTAHVTELPDGERTLTVRLDDSAEDGGFREVWLITADASALVSLGELDGKKGTFAVPSDIDLRDYVLVDVSQEPFDGDPAHSGDSIVRGQLEFS